MSETQPATAAEALLQRLKHNGVDYLFANGGTDFPPVIEAFAKGATTGAPMPEVVITPHETAAVAMAHGYYLVTGRPQAVMVHVNVGLANCVMGLINAASDNIPILMMSGRTPLTEHDRFGARMTPINYGQEMRDQTALVRESVKWDYEMRYPEQAAILVDRALAIAMTEPRGPVYLSLPREPLAEPWPADRPVGGPAQPVPAAAQPDAAAVDEAAGMIARAKFPLIIAQRGDPEGRLGAALARLAGEQAIAVCDFWAIRSVLATDHPMHAGFDVGPLLERADLVIVVDSPVPWIQKSQGPAAGAKVIHIGADPMFSRTPVRSYPSDLHIAADPAATLASIADALAGSGGDVATRRDEIASAGDKRRADLRATAMKGSGSPMTPAYVTHCISQAMDDDAVLFNELGIAPQFHYVRGANRCFTPPFSGGLGWGLPAAMGAALADRNRLAIAAVGDGSYTFANPVACHQIAESHGLPVLTIVMNNGIWNAVRRATLSMYPDGDAAQMNRIPVTSLEPTPDFTMIAAASRGWSERVESGADLPAALARAIAVVRNEKRQALLEVSVSV